MSEHEAATLDPAFVLHRRAYRETSALIEAFTRGHGRIALVARGARRPRSALRAVLRPFVSLLLSWSGRGEVATLRDAEQGPLAAELDGRALASGLYLNELMLRLTHRHDPHPELFDAYAEAIGALALDRTGIRVEDTLRRFEKRLLDAVGYGLVLECEAGGGQPIERSVCYEYHVDEGPRRAGSADAAPGGVAVRGATLLDLAAGRPLDSAAQREAKRLLRTVLSTHLGSRPLASRELFRDP